MTKNRQIEWHRYACEIFDPTILRHFHELHAEYRALCQQKSAMQPFITVQPENLTLFILKLLQRGIEATAKELRNEERQIHER